MDRAPKRPQVPVTFARVVGRMFRARPLCFSLPMELRWIELQLVSNVYSIRQILRFCDDGLRSESVFFLLDLLCIGQNCTERPVL